jgi:hypothetical protein
MREPERAGLTAKPEIVEQQSEAHDVPQSVVVQEVESPSTPPVSEVFVSRRERRLAEANGAAPIVESVASERAQVISEPITETSPVVVSDVILAALEEVALEAAAEPMAAANESQAPDFSSSNMLAEPSTQSIVLDVAPEAISLPLDTGEIFSTGSIAILPDPVTGSLTGALDGLNVDDADRMDAVTGVITTVDPVSALDVINQRVTVGVVPGDMLRKGWWQPWAYGALGLGLAVATIIATITIVTALGE